MQVLNDNVLSKNTRPLLLIFLVVFTTILIVVDASVSTFVVAPMYVELLKILLTTMVAAYYGSRGYEKGKAMGVGK